MISKNELDKFRLNIITELFEYSNVPFIGLNNPILKDIIERCEDIVLQLLKKNEPKEMNDNAIAECYYEVSVKSFAIGAKLSAEKKIFSHIVSENTDINLNQALASLTPMLGVDISIDEVEDFMKPAFKIFEYYMSSVNEVSDSEYQLFTFTAMTAYFIAGAALELELY